MAQQVKLLLGMLSSHIPECLVHVLAALLLIQFHAVILGKQQIDGTSARVPATHVQDPDSVQGFWV